MHFDVLIRGGLVVDGSGRTPAYPADVGIVGDRIAAMGDLGGATATETIDATGKIVSPGFIDVHIHSETNLLYGPHRYGGLMQGVTTQLAAPDGFGWAPATPQHARELWEYTEFAYGTQPRLPLGDLPTAQAYLDLYAGNTPANLVPQVPHCAVRVAAMGWDARPATEDELAAMKLTTREWLEAGATCLNLGLDYQPTAFADLREIVELSKVAREYDAIYAAHLRYQAFDGSKPRAWREIMEIGRRADIPVHVSHESVDDTTAPLLDEAKNICDLTFESYMYPAGCTHLALSLPIPEQASGAAGLQARLANPTDRARIRDEMQRRLQAQVDDGANPVFVETPTGRYIGMTVAQAAASEGETLGEFAVRVLAEEQPYALMVFHRGIAPERFERTIRDTIRHPAMMVASDGIYHGASGHPRGYGCFARVLRLCVREMGAVSLEEAVYKMSGYPAARFRVKNRGLLREQYGADVVIFDAATVADRSTWDNPWAEPVGIDRVLVNGETVVLHGTPTGNLPGRVLR